ncbi:unnamed protein product [Prorocentrum cordatum]|uniref:Secreted protein n=1 Tax=Prorocentrum cordatum TaxID=2364126 RepID=A0ABN9UF79_9DINO|nr:unnamed protein product [Polarella glacialis]
MWAQVLAGSIDILCLSLTVVLCDARTSFPNARPRSLTADAKARTNKQADRGSSGRASARCTVFPGAVGDTRRRRRSMRKREEGEEEEAAEEEDGSPKPFGETLHCQARQRRTRTQFSGRPSAHLPTLSRLP